MGEDELNASRRTRLFLQPSWHHHYARDFARNLPRAEIGLIQSKPAG